MKKIFLFVIVSLLLVMSAYAADKDTGTVAELYEHPHGRSVIYDGSELVTIWYTGSSSGGFGVSGSTATADLEVVFYEDGQVITATRFESEATIAIASGQLSTSNTVEQLVSKINSDTSGYFKAAQGRDATPGTVLYHLKTGSDVLSGLTSTEDASIDAGHVLEDDTSSSKQVLSGFKPNSRKTYRLKAIKGNVKGTGDAMIRVWDGKNVVTRLGYELTAYNSATPNIVSFTDYNAKGLAATRGKNLTVVTDWSTSLSTDTEAGVNQSIIVGEWTE